MLQLLLETFSLADVARRQDDSADAGVVAEVRVDRDDVDDSAVEMAEAVFDLVQEAVGLLEDRRADAVDVPGIDELEEAATDEVVGEIAEYALDRGRHVGDRPGGVDDGDRVGRVLDERGD